MPLLGLRTKIMKLFCFKKCCIHLLNRVNEFIVKCMQDGNDMMCGEYGSQWIISEVCND